MMLGWEPSEKKRRPPSFRGSKMAQVMLDKGFCDLMTQASVENTKDPSACFLR